MSSCVLSECERGAHLGAVPVIIHSVPQQNLDPDQSETSPSKRRSSRSRSSTPSEPQTCEICLLTYALERKPVPCPHCKKAFCRLCIDEWKCTQPSLTKGGPVTCPNCREVILSAPAPKYRSARSSAPRVYRPSRAESRSRLPRWSGLQAGSPGFNGPLSSHWLNEHHAAYPARLPDSRSYMNAETNLSPQGLFHALPPPPGYPGSTATPQRPGVVDPQSERLFHGFSVPQVPSHVPYHGPWTSPAPHLGRLDGSHTMLFAHPTMPYNISTRLPSDTGRRCPYAARPPMVGPYMPAGFNSGPSDNRPSSMYPSTYIPSSLQTTPSHPGLCPTEQLATLSGPENPSLNTPSAYSGFVYRPSRGQTTAPTSRELASSPVISRAPRRSSETIWDRPPPDLIQRNDCPATTVMDNWPPNHLRLPDPRPNFDFSLQIQAPISLHGQTTPIPSRHQVSLALP